MWLYTEIWRVAMEIPYRSNPIGSWKRSSGLNFLKIPDKYDRRGDLGGYFLRVATIKVNLDVMLDKKSFQNIHSYLLKIFAFK